MNTTVTVLGTLALGCLWLHINVKAEDRHDTRIIGGEEATSESQVVLLLNPNTTAQCTGTRIFPQWFLTSANCNPSGTTEDFIVISRNNNNGQYDNHTITKWINHNEYNNNKYWNNNIALVKVEPIIEGPHTAVLPNADDADYTNETGTVLGWGANCGFCSFSETLKKVDNLKIYSHEECEAIYGEGPTNSTICAGNPDKLEGICDGDNGSPLIVKNVIVGVTSWMRYPCASVPAVFTRVSHYIKWIHLSVAIIPVL